MTIWRREYGLDSPGGCVIPGPEGDWSEALKVRLQKKLLVRRLTWALRGRIADLLLDGFLAREHSSH